MSSSGKDLALTTQDSRLEKGYFPLSEMPLEGPSTALPFLEKLGAEGEIPFFGYVLVFA